MEFVCPYSFQCKARKVITTENLVVADHVYTFTTAKRIKYVVNATELKNKLFAVKFNLKMHQKNPNRYKVVSNHNDASRVLKTIVGIMVEIHKLHPESSFGFIGINSRNEPTSNTQRHRIYSALTQRYFNPERWIHAKNDNLSLYMIINKEANYAKVTNTAFDFLQQHNEFPPENAIVLQHA